MRGRGSSELGLREERARRLQHIMLQVKWDLLEESLVKEKLRDCGMPCSEEQETFHESLFGGRADS